MLFPSVRTVRSAFVVFYACTVLLVGVPATTHAAIADVFVSPSGNDVTGDGSTDAPFRTITHALTQVTTNGAVHVSPGFYQAGEVFPIVVPGTVTLESDAGPWYTEIRGDNVHSVVSIKYPLAHTELSGFTISGGRAVLGAGIQMIADGATTPVSNWPVISDCRIQGNASTGIGGGMFVLGNPGKPITPQIRDTDFVDNTASTAGGGIGVATDADPIVSRCELIGNTAASQGGNAYVYSSAGRFYYCDFDSGTAEWGGNVALKGDDSPEFVYSSVRDGVASSGGGGVYVEKTLGEVEFRGVRINGNQTTGAGGGVRVLGMETLSFENCLIDSNQAGILGGAIYIYSEENDTLYMSNCTVADNEAPDIDGVGVIDPDGIHSVAVYVSNSVFRHRQTVPGDETSVSDYSGFDTSDDAFAFSMFRNTSITGSGVIHGDPLFVDAAHGDYHLQKGSPAIDTGGAFSSVTLDLDLEDRPMDGNGVGGAQNDMGCYEHAPFAVGQLAGTTRYQTACEVALRGFYSADWAVIASGENFPDALSAAGLAGAHDGPVLLVKHDSVPAEVFDTLDELAVSKVVIVGGTAVVTPAVVSALEAEGIEVSRISGATRYETSAQVANELARLEGGQFSQIGLVARGDAYADALALGPLAYAMKAPVLLVKTAELPAAIAEAIEDTQISEVAVAGGTAAVGADVYAEIDALAPVTSIQRVFGADRYETAARLATEGLSHDCCSAGYIGIATGTNFPDALAGGAAAGNRGGVLLLCKPDSLPSAASAFLTTHKDVVVRADVYGGDAAVSPAVRAAVEDVLGW